MDDEQERPAGRLGPGAEPAGLPLGRAAFLGTVVAGVAGIGILSRYGTGVQHAVDRVASAVPVVSDIVPTDGWRIYTVADAMPRFDPATYRLRVTGLVEQPLDLSWADLAALHAERQRSDFHCVTGWTVRGVTWDGIRPSALLARARPRPEARYATIVSMEEPYVDQLSLEQLALPDVLLATGQDGRPLERQHGAPVRLVIPEMYGYKNVKWVSEVRLVARAEDGYWEQRGYDVDAWVGRSNGL